MGTNDGPTTQTTTQPNQPTRTRYVARYPMFGWGSRTMRATRRRRRLEPQSSGVSQVLPGMWVVMDPRITTRKPGMTIIRGSNRSR